MAGQGGPRSGAGKKKLPTHLKILKGTYDPSRENENQPEPLKEKPVPPPHLNERAVFHFHRFVELMGDTASASFVDITALLAITAEEIERYYQIIYDTPFFETVDSFGNRVLKNHPLSVQYKESKRHHHTLLMEVGLTHASIGRVSKRGPGKKVDPWDEI